MNLTKKFVMELNVGKKTTSELHNFIILKQEKNFWKSGIKPQTIMDLMANLGCIYIKIRKHSSRALFKL